MDEAAAEKPLKSPKSGSALTKFITLDRLLITPLSFDEFCRGFVLVVYQLTAALHIDDADYNNVRSFLPILERRVGRLLVNGFGNGVEVGHAMMHGGPYPATADGRSTSIGSLALFRFLCPVSYQDLPETLLSDALKADNQSRQSAWPYTSGGWHTAV